MREQFEKVTEEAAEEIALHYCEGVCDKTLGDYVHNIAQIIRAKVNVLAAVAAEREQLAKLLPTDADRYAYNLSEFYKHRKRLSAMDWATIISAANVLRECARAASAIRDGGKNDGH